MESALDIGQDAVRVPPRERHTGTVIFVHGLGQSNLTWKFVVVEALAQHFPNVQWVLPQAPRRPVTLNQGQQRPSWFDITHLPPYSNEYDEQGVTESVSVIENLILEQIHAGIAGKRIVLIGFSQGAALSMMTALTTLHELGGVASLSGWIPRRARDLMIHTEPELPIFWGHGVDDEEIPMEYAEEGVGFLRRTLRVPSLSFTRYDGLKHAINDEELEDVVSWLMDVLRLP